MSVLISRLTVIKLGPSGQTQFTVTASHLQHIVLEQLQVNRHALTLTHLRANEDFSALEKESISDLPQSKLSKM